jgi:ribonuclease P protein component
LKKIYLIEFGQTLKTYGFKKSDRILKHSEFERISNRGKAVQDQFFIVVYSPGDRGHSCIGITVSKRVGNAVVRNYLKRIIREIFRLNRNHIAGQWDINVIARKKAANLSYQQALQALKILFSKFKGDRH